MGKMVLVLGILFSGLAQAGQLTCTGNAYGYDVVLRAKMSGARFVSKANLVISKDREIVKQLTMNVTSSRFVAGRSLYFTAKSKEGNIVVNTAYNGSGYAGNVEASAPQGSITASTICSVR
jgi:hypothetical protein